MKIAYLNPWVNAAENQAFMSLVEGGKRIGIDLISCSGADEIERSGVDFVLSVASSVPKVADVPSYLTLHEPAKRFLTSRFYFQNMLSYDGFLTISDSLRRFAQDVTFGIGRADKVGFYYNTPQQSPLETDVTKLAESGALKLVYLGTNWDRRMPALFKTLDNREVLRIHGPEASWQAYRYNSFQGPLPFDGISPQRAYSEAGIGLVLLSAGHLLEDVISNRIFEISSVGAVSICPDMPWIRKWFGDNVLYFNSNSPTSQMAQQILEHYQFCCENPSAVAEMAIKARRVFEENFSAERMLESAVSYHEERQNERLKSRKAMKIAPQISVVVRCGGRSLESVKRAVDSIRSQSCGQFTVILSKYSEIDLSEITNDLGGAIVRFKEVLVPAGNRFATLVAGLSMVNTKYFSILDDDDFWLSDHVETVISAAERVDDDFDCGFSGSVAVSSRGEEIELNLFWKRNIYTFGFRKEPRSIEDVTGEFSSNCFIAKSELIPENLEFLPSQETAEDSFIIALVTRRKRPVFSYKATAFFSRHHEDQSDFINSPYRRRDLMSYILRAGLLYSPSWLPSGSTQLTHDAWQRYGAFDIADALKNSFGAPKISDAYEEFWDLTKLLRIGDAGEVMDDGSIVVKRSHKGCVFFGPYAKLMPARYRVSIHFESTAGIKLTFPSRKRPSFATFDVVCVDASWTGVRQMIPIGSNQYSCEFDVGKDTIGKEIEFRLFSDGLQSFRVKRVILEHVME